MKVDVTRQAWTEKCPHCSGKLELQPRLLDPLNIDYWCPKCGMTGNISYNPDAMSEKERKAFYERHARDLA